MIKVSSMQSKGRSVPNQFIINDNVSMFSYFQSYNSIIVSKSNITGHIALDSHYWNYSKTTGKYRNIFLGETKKETQAKINSGEYILANLN